MHTQLLGSSPYLQVSLKVEEGIEDEVGVIKDEVGVIEDEVGVIEDEVGVIEDEVGVIESEEAGGDDLPTAVTKKTGSFAIYMDRTVGHSSHQGQG